MKYFSRFYISSIMTTMVIPRIIFNSTELYSTTRYIHIFTTSIGILYM